MAETTHGKGGYDVALEFIASVSLLFGFTPSDSIVLAAFKPSGRLIISGPVSRMDLEMVREAANGDTKADLEVRRTFEVFATHEFNGAMVIYYPPEGTAAPKDIGWVADYFEKVWSLQIHGGYFAHSDQILVYDEFGAVRDELDAMELLATNVAVERGHCELFAKPEDFRWNRKGKLDPVNKVERKRKLAIVRNASGDESTDDGTTRAPSGESRGHVETRLLESEIWPLAARALAKGWEDLEALRIDDRALLRQAFHDPSFRDGFINWVLWDAPPVLTGTVLQSPPTDDMPASSDYQFEDYEVDPIIALANDEGYDEWIREAILQGRTPAEVTFEAYASLGAPTLEPNRDTIDRAITLLRAITRKSKVGTAGHLVATGAYLAWQKGNGAQARILCQQTLEESPNESLGQLVQRVLQANMAPPWMSAYARQASA